MIPVRTLLRRPVGLLGVAFVAWLAASGTARAWTANAADYGYNATDATDALQAAIHSGADTVLVPNMGSDWIVRPIFLAGNQRLQFEPGVVVTAKPGEFHGSNDSLFTAGYLSNIRIEAAGAVFRMQKTDYMNPALYTYSEWRHVLYFISCTNVTVIGPTLRDSGGDGIFIGSFVGTEPCRQVTIQNVICDNNYRQGISVTSAVDLRIENSVIRNTWGTNPQAGIDFEPDGASQELTRCTLRNCLIENNASASVLIYPQLLSWSSPDVSITFTGCTITSSAGWGIQLSPLFSDGVNGVVRFEDCLIRDVRGPGLYTTAKYAYKLGVEFSRCTWRNTGQESFNGFPANPLVLAGDFPDRAPEYGGLYFDQCVIEDNALRHFLVVVEPHLSLGCANLKGTLTVLNPFGATMDLGRKAHDIALTISTELTTTTPVVRFDRLVKVYPNPARGFLCFRLDGLLEPERLVVDLFSMAGRPVLHHESEVRPSQAVVQLNVETLPPGMYVYRAQRGAESEQGKICILRP